MLAKGGREAQIIENGKSGFAVDITASGHVILGDEPVEDGGANLGPAPYDLLLAALGECTAMTMRWYAKRENWPLEKVEVRMAHHKEAKTDVFTKEIALTGEKLTQEQRDKLVDVAAKCPVQRTLEGTPRIQTIRVDA